jgi:stress response protein SCP2
LFVFFFQLIFKKNNNNNNNQPQKVWFQKLRSADGSMVHQGDEREGDEVGDDESINVKDSERKRVKEMTTFTND